MMTMKITIMIILKYYTHVLKIIILWYAFANGVNGAFNPDNFDHVLMAVEIMISLQTFVKMIWI